MPKLFVIPGHGAGDPGATGYGYDEAERVRALATRIKELGGDDVMLADFSRNYYADNGISTMSLPSGYCIVELHMDSGPSGAFGGHVIIQAGTGGADQYDRALESLMKRIFPGRANTIVERSDLANPARAAARGFNYRLVENGFISNRSDLDTFNECMDEIALGYLQAFGINVYKDYPSVHTHTPNQTPAQQWQFVESGDGYLLRCLACDRYLMLNRDLPRSEGFAVCAGPKEDADVWQLVQLREGEPLDRPIQLVCDGLYLDVVDGKLESGAGIQARSKSTSRHGQKWAMVWAGRESTYFLHNLLSDMCLDVDKGGK